MKIRSYLLLVILIPTALAVMFSVIMTTKIATRDQLSHDVTNLKLFQKDISRLIYDSRQYFISTDLIFSTGESHLIDGALILGDAMQEQLQTIESNSNVRIFHNQVAELKSTLIALINEVNVLTNLVRKNPSLVHTLSLDQYDILGTNLLITIENTLDQTEIAIDQAQSSYAAYGHSYRVLSFLLPAIFSMSTLLLWFWTYRSLTSPIQELHNATKKSGEKGLSHVNNGPKEVQELSASFHDLTKRLFYQANHDSLTGLYNRMAFNRILKELYEDVSKQESTHTLCFIDLDHFKVINDTCGHGAGDELLKQLASIMTTSVRDEDIVARQGGDEFTILFRDCSAQKARFLTEKVRQRIKDYEFYWGDEKFHVSSSFGISAFSPKSSDITSTFNLADLACMHAKKTGRNCVIDLPDRSNVEPHQSDTLSLNDIMDALKNDHFTLYKQEIVDARRSGAAHGKHFEILLRLKNKDPDKQDLRPNAFMPTVDRFGLFPELDRWVIRSTIDWLLSDSKRLLSIELCSINLSGNSICNSEMLKFIEIELKRLEGQGCKLCFEITETEAINDFDYAKLLIDKLKSFGCKVALDDFGSGLSSFSYLKNLDIDFVKIDGSFVRDMLAQESDRATVQAILDVARAFNKLTIAEFVENEDLADLLTNMGCDYLQGYHFDQPKPVDPSPVSIDNILTFTKRR